MDKKSSTFRRLQRQVRTLLEGPAPTEVFKLSRLHRFAHFWVLVGRSFSRNRCPVRASALAYATLLALIPMLAVVASVTSSFLKKEGEDRIDQFIVKLVASVTTSATSGTSAATAETAPREAGPPGERESTPPTAEKPADRLTGGNTNVSTGGGELDALPAFARADDAIQTRKAIARYIHEFIQNTRSGALGVTGSILLIFAAISMLSRIETTFNDIWGAARGRSWFMRIVLYWGVITLAPLLLVLAFGLATGPHLEATKDLLHAMPFVANLIFQLLPVVVLCLTFSVFYILIPNTHVNWGAALVGGITGGILFHLNNLVSVLYVSRVVSNSKIYGSLGLVPVFMIGLYFSWVILLFGAQVAYAFQNRTTYFEEKQAENINQRGREFIALRLMTLIGQRYLEGDRAPSVVEMAGQLGVPSRVILQILQTLGAARLVVETAGAKGGYLPARPMDNISCHDILHAMRAAQGMELATQDEPTRAEVYGEFQRIQEAERLAASSVTMQALASRAVVVKRLGGGSEAEGSDRG